MRTAIYVEQLSSVTILASDPRDTKIELCRYNRPPNQPAVGMHALEPGVYLIISSGSLTISGVHGGIETMGGDKDDWPDPKPNVVALEPGATAGTLKQFFTIAKGVSRTVETAVLV